jgi:hypothetical protein
MLKPDSGINNANKTSNAGLSYPEPTITEQGHVDHTLHTTNIYTRDTTVKFPAQHHDLNKSKIIASNSNSCTK